MDLNQNPFFLSTIFLLLFSNRIGNKIYIFLVKALQSCIQLENTELKQRLLRIKVAHNGGGVGNPARSIRGSGKVQRMTTKSFIDHPGRKIQLKEINKMLWCLLHSMKNREQVKINILQIERTKLRGKVLLSKARRCIQNRGTNSEFSTQTKLCCQPGDS